MEPTQFSPRTWCRVLKAVIFALEQLLAMLDNFDEENDDTDVDPNKDLTRFTTIIARKSVKREQLDYFAAKISEALRTAAAAMPSSDCPDCRTAREQCRQVITNLLGRDARYWRTFSDRIDEALDLLADKNKLSEISNYQRAYRDIAEGILKA